MTMARGERDKHGAPDAPQPQNRRTIPTDLGGTQYPDKLDTYLNQLLDDALDGRRPAGDAPSPRNVDKR